MAGISGFLHKNIAIFKIEIKMFRPKIWLVIYKKLLISL